jgi:CheY-like chemotaxis protein
MRIRAGRGHACNAIRSRFTPTVVFIFVTNTSSQLLRVLIVDDSEPRRRLLKALLRVAGYEVVAAPDGVAALEILTSERVDAVVSDVKMPRMDGFQLCHTLRRDERWARMPFIFYSSVFTADRAQRLGMDLGATAYLDAKHVRPNEIAAEIHAVVSRVVSAEYRETLMRLHDDLDFARRYHEVVMSSLDAESGAGIRTSIASNVRALDEILARLDAERRALAARTNVTVPRAELRRLKELSQCVGDKLSDPLAVILQGADSLMPAPDDATNEAVVSIRAAVRHINELVRNIARRDASRASEPLPDDE